MKKNDNQLTRIVFGAVMAAIICVITLFRIPLGQSKVHFANAMCLLAGLLLGPVTGGLSAGLGSALYDVLFGGYGPLDAVITFVSKFAMAWVAAVLFRAFMKKYRDSSAKETILPLVISCGDDRQAGAVPDQCRLCHRGGADLLPRGAAGPEIHRHLQAAGRRVK